MKGKSDMASIFEKMIQDFRRKDMAQLLEECMKPDVKKSEKNSTEVSSYCNRLCFTYDTG